MNQSKDWSEEMYRFVECHPEGVREKDVKQEFEGKISHSTCVKYWKALKESGRVQKAFADDGSIRYDTRKWFAERNQHVCASQIGSEKSKLSIICYALSLIMPVIFFTLFFINIRPEVHRAVNMLNSTLTTTHKQVILSALETYPYIVVSVAISALLFYTLRFSKHPARSLT